MCWHPQDAGAPPTFPFPEERWGDESGQTSSEMTDAAASEARRLAEVTSGIGCLVSNDGRTKTGAGSFQDADTVAALMWSMSHSFETVAAMAEVGSYAASKLIPMDVRTGST